jgi:excisionase family DNA binding protein
MSHMKLLLTTSQLARILGVGRATIYRWLADGSIKASAQAGRQPIWTERDIKRIQKWMRKNYQPKKASRGA